MATSSPLLQFFAGVVDPEGEIEPQRIRIEQVSKAEMTELFERQAHEHLNDDMDQVDFLPKTNYQVNRNQVFVIRNLPLPMNFVEATLKPEQTAEFSLSRQHGLRISTIFGAEASGKVVKRLLFQQFRAPQLLVNRFSLFLRGNTFQRIENAGLSLADELVAIYEKDCLFFRSFAIVSRFFDLSAYEPTATPEEIENFVSDVLFDPEDGQTTLTTIQSDDWLSRRVASIHSLGILKAIKPKATKNKAIPFGIDIDVVRVHGKDRIRLPKEKKRLKQIVKFLNEEYFHGELTEEMYETNSLRRIRST
jgi:hypothetical protein